MQAEHIVPPPGTIIKWRGLNWKPAPDGVHWHRWDPKEGGVFEMLTEDQIPDQFWADLAKKALLNER